MAFFVHILLFLLSLYQTNAGPLERPKQTPSVRYSWTNCGADADPFHFNALSLSPDPIKLPGDITIGISVTLSIPFPPDMTVIVVVEKQVAGFWIKVPCVDNFGSCVYRDVCGSTNKFGSNFFGGYTSGKCPPLPPGTYSVENVTMHITKSLPPEATGNFRITMNPLSNAAGQLGCIQTQVNLSN